VRVGPGLTAFTRTPLGPYSAAHAGFDDDRAIRYVELYETLAVAAAWGGDDATAKWFFIKAASRDLAEFAKQDGDRGDDQFFWLKTLLAGAAEGLLPRKYLHVLIPAFRSGY
jgi:hypothetical protein